MSAGERWPTAVDYQTALQTPALCFNDLALKQSRVYTDTLGLPLAATGNVVVVFRTRLARGEAALRCFTRKTDGAMLAHRYKMLRVVADPDLLPMLVPCRYRPDEVLVLGTRYPVVQMPWVPGLPLHRYVETHLHQPEVLKALAGQWRAMMARLAAADVAHGDLADGNVLVDDRGTIRLIDYDGAYLPLLRGDPPGELGKPNYQHPGRLDPDGPDYGYYAPNVDAFSALVIYLSLRALADDPARWRRYHTGENLIFDKTDFRNPGYTPIWLDLRNGQSDEVARLADVLEGFCRASVADLPDLEDVLQGRVGRQAAQEAIALADDPAAQKALAPGEAQAGPLPRVGQASSPWRRTRYLAGAMALLAVLAVLVFVRGLKNEAQGHSSLVAAPEAAEALLPPGELAGFYTGYATSLEGRREPMALFIDSLYVDSTEAAARFTYSVNWKAHYVSGLGHYDVETGQVDLESHYVLRVARATTDEVVLASVARRDRRPLVQVNKRMTP